MNTDISKTIDDLLKITNDILAIIAIIQENDKRSCSICRRSGHKLSSPTAVRMGVIETPPRKRMKSGVAYAEHEDQLKSISSGGDDDVHQNKRACRRLDFGTPTAPPKKKLKKQKQKQNEVEL
jgi:hypothetical protein